ncbi:glycosyltransferase [Vibrio parahaemolyticus]|nr:PssE/Cps14G family polysaccharide biosynthesis glycosyltransferase [Vibrio parahaemolyticus]ELA8076917.1 glycosyltransferase [Vibrio alginolyticus]ETZ08204.1 glycosyltransferase [Vibrio parahaemolyticus M0605]AWG85228.1 glycosyltransferase [Vibrio parahaemolyticus]EGQ7794232.1 glycosyltransferase [Vibrio parahaemolyticus]EGQ7807922.1 glycosyltransferase [Vibrio parahaemolyticus]
MNILVTVGTTAFDELITVIDESFKHDQSVNIIAQISSSSNYTPKYIESFEFSDDFDSFVESADIIITHAGAGSVYSMLEKGKKLVVVPNLTRVDDHQLELAKYVQNNNFALSCSDLEKIKICINNVKDFEFKPYRCEKFFGHDIIRGLLK